MAKRTRKSRGPAKQQSNKPSPPEVAQAGAPRDSPTEIQEIVPVERIEQYVHAAVTSAMYGQGGEEKHSRSGWMKNFRVIDGAFLIFVIGAIFAAGMAYGQLGFIEKTLDSLSTEVRRLAPAVAKLQGRHEESGAGKIRIDQRSGEAVNLDGRFGELESAVQRLEKQLNDLDRRMESLERSAGRTADRP